MNCRITATPEFKKQLKMLAKRYSSMRDDYETFLNEIKSNPFVGTPLGQKLRKVRFAITSKGKGKSGGARVITHTVILSEEGTDVSLLYIYDKTDQATITIKEINTLLRKNGLI